VPMQLEPAPAARPAPWRDRHRGLRLLLTAGAVVLFAATALGAWWDVASHKAASAADTSVAVLPLVNVSRDPQDAAFVDGLTEDLIGALAKVPGLRVISPTSAFAFRNSDLGVRRIADSLGVSNVLEGSAQRIGAQLRIRLRLVDARDGSTRWSETYNREMRDVFSVQSDVAGGVARELNLRLGGSTLGRLQRLPTSSIAAYELYVRGNDPALTRSDSGARAGLELFRQAIELDPRYAAAYAGVARMQMRLGFGGDDTTMSRRDRVAVAEDAARKAVALDVADGDAHASLGFIYRHNYDFASAEVEMKRAVALEPTSAHFREWLVQLYVFTGRRAEALAEAHEAVRLDPLSPTANAEVARALLANDRCDESLAQLEKLRHLRPPLLRAGSIAAQCYARMGRWQDAVAALARNSANAGVAGRGFFGYMLARAGRKDEARRILADLREHSRGGDPNTFAVASVYAGLGERDAAFRWLERALDERELDLEQLDTVLDGLRPDPRVEQLRERMGLQKR
jgi:TolB-like protein/tetratricopeptide (TPR) repeat protein